MVIDGRGIESKEVFSKETLQGFDLIRAEVMAGNIEPYAKVEYRHRKYVQDKHFELLRRLNPLEAKILGETLITAAEAAETAVKKEKAKRGRS